MARIQRKPKGAMQWVIPTALAKRRLLSRHPNQTLAIAPVQQFLQGRITTKALGPSEYLRIWHQLQMERRQFLRQGPK